MLRANKAPFAWGLEPRVPFLDKAFLDVTMDIDPQLKMVPNCTILWSSTVIWKLSDYA